MCVPTEAINSLICRPSHPLSIASSIKNWTWGSPGQGEQGCSGNKRGSVALASLWMIWSQGQRSDPVCSRDVVLSLAQNCRDMLHCLA